MPVQRTATAWRIAAILLIGGQAVYEAFERQRSRLEALRP